MQSALVSCPPPQSYYSKDSNYREPRFTVNLIIFRNMGYFIQNIQFCRLVILTPSEIEVALKQSVGQITGYDMDITTCKLENCVMNFLRLLLLLLYFLLLSVWLFLPQLSNERTPVIIVNDKFMRSVVCKVWSSILSKIIVETFCSPEGRKSVVILSFESLFFLGHHFVYFN